MKTKLLFLIITIFSLSVNAQLVELDNTGEENSGSISSIAVYDNDIMYSISNDSGSLRTASYVSNGIAGEQIELFPEANFIFTFSKYYSFKTNIHGYGNYSAGNKIFAVGRQRSSTTSSMYEFNKSRTAVISNNIFGNYNGEPIIRSVGKNELLTVSNVDGADRYHLFTKNNTIVTYEPENFTNSSQSAVNFFKYNDNLHFSYAGIDIVYV